jgi:hypothetical protein
MLVIHKLKVLEVVIKHAARAPQDAQLRRRVRRAAELQVGLGEVIQVQMAVAAA